MRLPPTTMTFITVNNRSEFPMLNHNINYPNLIGRPEDDSEAACD